MNDNKAYIVQCTKDNFDDVKYMINVFCRILDVDALNYSLKASSVDSIMKCKLDEMGASFWQETGRAVERKTPARRKA